MDSYYGSPPNTSFERNRRFRNQLPAVSPEIRGPSTPRRHRSIDLCTQEEKYIYEDCNFHITLSSCRIAMKRSFQENRWFLGGLSWNQSIAKKVEQGKTKPHGKNRTTFFFFFLLLFSFFLTCWKREVWPREFQHTIIVFSNSREVKFPRPYGGRIPEVKFPRPYGGRIPEVKFPRPYRGRIPEVIFPRPYRGRIPEVTTFPRPYRGFCFVEKKRKRETPSFDSPRLGLSYCAFAWFW